MKPGNVLKIKTLDKDWSDKDQVMLHACFQLLCDCIEKEKLLDSTDWEHNQTFRNAKKEIEELYAWWKIRAKVQQNNKLDPVWTEGQYDKDSDMLIRLIRIRKFLWT
jgi:hypothetical protein